MQAPPMLAACMRPASCPPAWGVPNAIRKRRLQNIRDTKPRGGAGREEVAGEVEGCHATLRWRWRAVAAAPCPAAAARAAKEAACCSHSCLAVVQPAAVRGTMRGKRRRVSRGCSMHRPAGARSVCEASTCAAQPPVQHRQQSLAATTLATAAGCPARTGTGRL